MDKKDYVQIINMLNQWIILYEEGKRLERYFSKNEYKKIAIYGMGIYARHLIRNLKDTDIEVVCGIDIAVTDTFQNIPVYRPDELPCKVDIIVNTVLRQHNEICMQLNNKYDVPVVSLEDVVFESY